MDFRAAVFPHGLAELSKIGERNFVEYPEAEFLNVFIHWPFLHRLNDHTETFR